MKINKIFWLNIFMTILFLGFNVIVTYYPELDDYFWLVPGLVISGIAIILSLTIAIMCKNLINEIIFLVNVILLLYYVYPLIYTFF
ncbi:type II toxin-antitoxin system antitoxin TsaA [Staphylococcus caledonicus]|uniref:type II toxin-antitoxin system antitoxin TsaA n=1 Tax=Staphylococcus caledonicus TaxID=2741333 RepID=UPI0038CD29C3